jgi:hypothetical protein
MKTIAKTLLLLTAGVLFNSCSTTAAPAGGSTAATATGVKPYPLKTCIVTGNDLGSMGDDQRIVHEGQEIKFCCKPCVGKFQKNPAKYLSRL